MLRFRFRTMLLAVAVLAVAALAAIPALGAVVRIGSHVTISSKAPAFHGRAVSERHACEVHRRVKLYRQRQGDDKLLGADRTNQNARWKIVVDPLKSGAYYARMKRREEGTAGTTFVCRGDRSKTVVID